MISLLTPENGAAVTLLQKKHLAYIREPQNDPTSKVDWLNLRETQDDLSFPQPLRLSYLPAVDAEVVLTRPDGKTKVISAKNGEVMLFNLLIDAVYTWYVRIGTEASEPFTFHTCAQAPRLMYVDGISNVRDFGGFFTTGGKRIRQEMIYRSSELDSHVAITPAGMCTLENELNIRTDLDIRGIKDEPRCPILDEKKVKWINIPLAAYADCFSEDQKKLFGQSFSLLTDKNLYPMIVHCWGGIDRTGTWLYILGAMLGVSEDDLGLDYEFSSFSRWGRRSRRSEQFVSFLDGLRCYGKTLQDAATAYMMSCGLNDRQLHQIQNLLLE